MKIINRKSKMYCVYVVLGLSAMFSSFKSSAQVYDLKNVWDISAGVSYITDGMGVTLSGAYYFSPTVNMRLEVFGASLKPYKELDREKVLNVALPFSLTIKVSKTAGILIRPYLGPSLTMLDVPQHDFKAKLKLMGGLTYGAEIEKTFAKGWGLAPFISFTTAWGSTPRYQEWSVGIKVKKYLKAILW